MRLVLKYFVSVAVLLIYSSTLGISQTIWGKVHDETQIPLPLVNVSIPAIHCGTTTDSTGTFTLSDITAGVYTIEFSLLGYWRVAKTVRIDSKSLALDIILTQTTLETPGFIITGTPQPKEILSSTQSVTVLEERDLTRLRGQSAMDALKNVPGVSTYTTGAGITKPVIRGLTSQRVLVVADGVRQEGQQWGDEHGPEIDVFDVQRMEVLRGPSGVLYGADAIGGVVSVVKKDIPSLDKGAPMLGAVATVNGFTNNHQIAGDIALWGAFGILGYRGHVSMRNAGNISTPEGELQNSGMKEFNAASMVGTHAAWGTMYADISHVTQHFQIHEDPVEHLTATPFQNIQHTIFHVHGDIPTPFLRLEIDASTQQNDRQEFEHSTSSDPRLSLQLLTSITDAKFHHHPIGNFYGTWGISLTSQKNRSVAEERLIPNYSSQNFAGYWYEELLLDYLTLSAGVRYDKRTVDIQATPELNVTTQSRSFQSATTLFGAVWRKLEPLSIAVNAGQGWRPPSAYELFVQGVHEGTIQYVIGNSALETERAFNIDVTIRFSSSKIQGEWTLFHNSLNNYIFTNPTNKIDSVSRFPIYHMQQAAAVMIGSEFSIQAQTIDNFTLGVGVDYMQATNKETGRPLPLIPANRARISIRWSQEEFTRLKSPYLSCDIVITTAQTRVEQFESPTAGYTLVNIGMGGEVFWNAHRIMVDLSVDNLFDIAYRDHLNRYKAYALNAGRNVILKCTIPFTFIQ